uniref:Putative abc transporter n=1 Tax=Ixodes ricinus TaxID=34613 RepID=A0A0K8RFF0_IXORI
MNPDVGWTWKEVSQFLLLSTQFWTVPLRIIMTLGLAVAILGALVPCYRRRHGATSPGATSFVADALRQVPDKANGLQGYTTAPDQRDSQRHQGFEA